MPYDLRDFIKIVYINIVLLQKIPCQNYDSYRFVGEELRFISHSTFQISTPTEERGLKIKFKLNTLFTT